MGIIIIPNKNGNNEYSPTTPETFKNKTIPIESNNVTSNGTVGSALIIGNSGKITTTDEPLNNILSKKLDKNQGVENAGKVLVVDNDGEIVPSAEQSGGKSKWHLVLNEIMKKEDPFDLFLMDQGYIKKSVGGLVDLMGCPQIKAWLKNLALGFDKYNIAEANRTIIYDDKVWQQAAANMAIE